MSNHASTLFAATASAAILIACSPSPVERAKRQLQMIEKHGSEDEICAAKQEVARAYLEDFNTREYDMAKLDADIFCLNVKLNRRLR